MGLLLKQKKEVTGREGEGHHEDLPGLTDRAGVWATDGPGSWETVATRDKELLTMSTLSARMVKTEHLGKSQSGIVPLASN